MAGWVGKWRSAWMARGSLVGARTAEGLPVHGMRGGAYSISCRSRAGQPKTPYHRPGNYQHP